MKKHSEKNPVIIQWCDTDPGPCVVCSKELTWGPVGFRTSESAGPMCDGCTLALNRDLGMMLMMAHVARELSQIVGPQSANEQMIALMAISKIYDDGAEWPARPVAAMAYMKKLEERAAQVPVSALLKMSSGETN